MAEKTPFIGQMDRQIQVIELVKTQNATGEQEDTDSVITTVFAYMNDVSGGETVDGKVRHLINRTYTVRWNPAIKQKSNTLVVIDGALRFEVYHLKEMGRKSHLQLLVKDYE